MGEKKNATTERAPEPSPQSPDAQMAAAVAEEGTPKTRADIPETAAGEHAHGPSQPDQASAIDKSAADATAIPVRGAEADAADNEIEATTRAMAGAGATAGEIAAYRADALAKLAE